MADDKDIEREVRLQARNFWISIGVMGLGGVLTGVGFAGGAERTGDAATGWGVLAGLGVGMAVCGAILSWLCRPGRRVETEALTRDRMQRQRVRLLALFSLVNIAFLMQATWAIADILEGTGSFGDYIAAPLPVLYAWVVALTTLGLDHQSRTHRKFLEDELTQLLRSRAVTAAFLVLMGAMTMVFGLSLWRPELATYGVLYGLTAAGATAGLRFVWLDREFSRDG
ncbi:hypothetical protein [Brevundimonas aurifodinae]|uniref:Uncharacterized protein n=2 Tax=Brevundimonas TaxID=41275 RepID=A0ABV1NN57_9CAUL|nr:MAG: hypothetical protein B7Z42_00400 [Brevundimonas sp. 12-68-7]OYX30535.1 MAG: hypothetical protein B7Z01_14175 [Brevundimonas subvibrioides]